MAKPGKILTQADSIRNIRTVTRTMAMVSRVSFRKAFARVTSVRPYTIRLTDLVGDVVRRSESGQLDHPLLMDVEGSQRDALVVLTSNRGLCGAYNQRVAKLAAERIEQLRDADYEVRLHVVGKRGAGYLRSRGYQVDESYTQFDRTPDYATVREIADELMNDFLAGKITGMEVAYMQLISSGRYGPAVAQILPLSHLETPRAFQQSMAPSVSYEFMPSADETLRRLLPATVRLKLYQCFLDASASEHLARITAMQSATDNADEMIGELTMRYNRIRQSRITTELAELTAGGGRKE